MVRLWSPFWANWLDDDFFPVIRGRSFSARASEDDNELTYSIGIPGDIDREGLKVSREDDVLKIRMPKLKKVKKESKEIEVG